MAQNDELTLARRVRALPQELQDMICDHVTSHESTKVITLTEDYRPPLRLQLHQKLRHDFAVQYYGGTTIRVTDVKTNIMPKFLGALPSDHLSLLHGLEYDTQLAPAPGLLRSRLQALALNRTLWRQLPKALQARIPFERCRLSYMDKTNGGQLAWMN